LSTSIGTTSGAIYFSGLGSGTDLSSIVDQLVELERVQIDRMELWKEEWNEKITSIQGLNTRVFSLYDFAKTFNEDFEFYARSSSSSDTSVVSVTNTPLAQPGAHTITVASSTQHRVGSIGFANSTTVVGGSASESLSILVGSTTITLNYGSNYAAGEWDTSATLADLVDAISAADATAGDLLEAIEIINDGSASNAQRLVMTAKAAGRDNQISVASDPTNLDLDGDSAEMMDSVVEAGVGWTGTASIDPTGNYYGHTNKRFNFTVANTGTVSSGNITITWSDAEGNSGRIVVSAAGTYDIYQGVQLAISSGDLTANQTFSLDVYNPTLQQGQDTGLAQVDQVTHGGFIDADTTAITSASGTFSYFYGGVETSITVAAGSTLTDLVNAINNDENNPGVTASILNDGQGLATSYHLVLTGKDTGAAYSITNINETLDNFSNDFDTTQTAQNSMFKLDGYPNTASVYLQRASNQISDVLEGVQLKLRSPGTASVTVENDVSQIAEGIEQFVNSVNFVLEYIREETKYDADTGEAGVMLGNYTFNIVYDSIRTMLYTAVPGLSQDTDTYTMLAQIGIHTDPDNQGLFTIDYTALDEALTNDLDSVARLFIKDEERGTEGVAELIRSHTYDLSDSIDGPMNILIKNYQGIIDSIDKKIEDEERRVAMVKSRLTEQFSQLEATLSVLSEQQTQLEQQIEQLPTLGSKK